VKVHNIRVKAYARKEEREELRVILRGFLPEETEIKEEELAPEADGGVFTQPLFQFTAMISGGRSVKAFQEKLLAGLSEKDREALLGGVEQRVDDDCNFYLRLSKKELSLGRFIVQATDSVHIKLKVAAYPAKKETAVAAVKTYLEGVGDG